MSFQLYANIMVYNELPFLDLMFEQMQTFCDHIVLMDNGSTDGSREWVEEHGGILNQQTDPPHYGNLRNRMLEVVPEDAWMLAWSPDELPSDAMMRDLRGIVEEYQGRRSGWRIPHYHIFKSPRTCLPIDSGNSGLQLFQKTAGITWQRSVHERPTKGPHPYGFIGPDSGIALIHFSYFAEARLRRKALHYASIHHSGFFDNPTRLTDRLDLEPIPLPEHITYQASDDWLEKIRAMP